MASKKKKNSSGIIKALVAVAVVLIAVSGFLFAKDYYQRQSVLAKVSQTPGSTPSGDDISETPTNSAVVSVDRKLVVGETDLTGVSLSDARATLAQSEQSLRDSAQFTIIYGDQTWTISPEEIEFSSDWEQVLEKAYAEGEDGTYEITHAVTIPKLDEIIASIAAQIDVEPQNATVAAYDETTKTFTFNDDIQGAKVDQEQLKYKIEAAAVELDFSTAIEVDVITTDAQYTSDYMQENFVLMGSYTTTAKNDSARNNNIKLALEAFNGRILQPGEEFSFNGTTGERTTDKGYKVAGVILDGASGEDVGGGVCQVSSTLFNAVVRAGLEITERYPHTYPSDYISAGMDAMVNWPDKDLKFVNSSSAEIYFVTAFDTSTRELTVDIYGIPIYPVDVKVDLRSERYEYISQPEDIITLNDQMYVDEVAVTRKGRAGSKWRTYRQFFDSEGNLLYEEELCTSVYYALANRLVVGTMIRE